MSLASSDPHKLDLMAENSSLKVKLAKAEKTVRDSEERLGIAQVCFFTVCILLLPRLRYIGGRGNNNNNNRGTISLFVSLFIWLYLSLLARLWENGWTDLDEIFREGVEWLWDDLVPFLVISEKLHDAAMRNTGAGFVVFSHHSLLLLLLKKNFLDPQY